MPEMFGGMSHRLCDGYPPQSGAPSYPVRPSREGPLFKNDLDLRILLYLQCSMPKQYRYRQDHGYLEKFIASFRGRTGGKGCPGFPFCLFRYDQNERPDSRTEPHPPIQIEDQRFFQGRRVGVEDVSQGEDQNPSFEVWRWERDSRDLQRL